MTIELAPRSKQGLALASPLMAGSGAVGFADAWPPSIHPRMFGAIVTAAISLKSRQGLAQPRLVELPGGFVLATGDQNPGLRRVVAQHAPAWPRLGVPIILACAAAAMGDWEKLAIRIEEEVHVAGIELHVPDDVEVRPAVAAITAARRATTLPLLVKLPVAAVAGLAGPAVDAGADALVIGTAPRAACPAADGEIVEGPVAGPLAYPFTLAALRTAASLRLGVPLVAAGGIHTPADASRCLELGASAVQVRSLLWTDPAAAGRLAETVSGVRV